MVPAHKMIRRLRVIVCIMKAYSDPVLFQGAPLSTGHNVFRDEGSEMDVVIIRIGEVCA
jgi:hypothetical protein